MTEKVNFDLLEEEKETIPSINVTMCISENKITEKPTTPKYGSPEWSDYILSLLTEDEKPKGNPTCAGLRRIVEDLLGEIIDTGPMSYNVFADADGKMRATVLYRVVFSWKMNVEEYVDMSKFEYPTKEFREVGESWPGNTPKPFDVHAAATASTRAEGRALRKALKLKVATAEEMNTGTADNSSSSVMDSSDSASGFQKNMIRNKCEALKIDLEKFLPTTIEKLTHYDAGKLLDKLISFIKDGSKIPQEIKL